MRLSLYGPSTVVRSDSVHGINHSFSFIRTSMTTFEVQLFTVIMRDFLSSKHLEDTKNPLPPPVPVTIHPLEYKNLGITAEEHNHFGKRKIFWMDFDLRNNAITSIVCAVEGKEYVAYDKTNPHRESTIYSYGKNIDTIIVRLGTRGKHPDAMTENATILQMTLMCAIIEPPYFAHEDDTPSTHSWQSAPCGPT